MLLLIILLVIVFGWGGGYYGNRYATGYGPHFGIGGILLILLVCWALGLFGGLSFPRLR